MITININGLTLCHKGSGGVSHNTLPDVCKTPGEGIPVPYENEAYSADLVKGTVSVFADGGNMIANLGSQFARSVFDEQGSMGGVKSGTNKAEAEWISHSFDVFFEGKPACRLTDKMYMNHRNTVNMAGLQQDFLPPRPELDDESYIPPAEDDDKSYLSPAENSDKSETPSSENDDKSDAPPPEDKDKAMPCIVILVHGVNDVGEAYENQDTGICRGLNTRLGREDFQPHTWQPEQFMISDVEGEVANSPVIPFYWGYKPVEHSAWVEDQKRYRDDLTKKHDEADLPYDTYQEFNEENIAAHAGEHIDSRNNWLDKQHANARGGGTFANATTSIPDIFGPGANGLSVWMVGEASRSWLNGGDWTHPVYSNPHRIYIAYAARRLADLILKIRRDSGAKNDTINVVAHSQGTIITMLANMWVKAEKQNPADCVILCHSPYSLENRWQENGQPGNQQTDDARQQTLAHFCNMMKKNGLHDGSTSHNADYISQLHANNCLTDEGQTAWATETYNRNNFGLVYNYFCPEDQVVSMMPIQGMGWRGIPDPLSRSMGDNIRQRVFCKDEAVGNKTGYLYIAKDIRKLDRNRVPVPEPKIKDPDKPVQDVIYLYNDVIINAPLLPVSFNFTLNGQDNNYRSAIGGNDVYISRAAMMAEAFVTENIDIPNTAEFHTLPLYQFLNNEQLSEVSALHNIVAISGQKVDVYDVDYYARHEKLKIQRRMKEDEIESALLKGTTYSQHSSIVSNDDVPEKAMTYDLAIGQCKAYEKTEFWRDLLLQADWRRPDNPDTYTRRYYSEGKLPDEFKKMMNKPETGEKPMPTGENGVVNDYGPRREIDWRNGKWVSVTQWDQPDPVPPELL